MATVTIPWGDGTSDKLYVTYSGAVGSNQTSVTSDPNFTAVQRVKVVNFKSTSGVQLATLTVSQKAKARDFNADFNKDFG